jgi:hypothetical protein
MTFIEEASVSLTDVAKRAGLTVDEVKAEAAALNMFVGEDWKHQEALSAKDAFVLLDGSARRNLEHQNVLDACCCVGGVAAATRERAPRRFR